MRIHNLYTDPSGQSHFRDIEVEWAEERHKCLVGFESDDIISSVMHIIRRRLHIAMPARSDD